MVDRYGDRGYVEPEGMYVLWEDYAALQAKLSTEVTEGQRLREALKGMLWDDIENECDECGGVAVDCPSDCVIRIARAALAQSTQGETHE